MLAACQYSLWRQYLLIQIRLDKLEARSRGIGTREKGKNWGKKEGKMDN